MITLLFVRYSLLIGGSKGYSNYRHQSDIMTLSTMLHSDKDNVVTTLIYDDIAYNKQNPFKGQLFNDYLHNNVYNKSFINSTHINITNIRKLMNNLTLTKDDTLFIFYNNHGAPGMLCTPKNRRYDNQELFADDLEKLLKELRKKVKQILFVIEACYSGSVAKYISLNNVLTISSATSIESSYSAKWDYSIGAHLTNLFTLNFINYINEHHNNEKIIDMINYVSKYTERSTINVFGDTSLMNETIKSFIGNIKPIPRDNVTDATMHYINDNAIDSHETLTKYYKTRMIFAPNRSTYEHFRMKLNDEIKRRHEMKRMIRRIVYHIQGNLSIPRVELEKVLIRDFDCYHNATMTFKRDCGYIDEVETAYFMPKMAWLCNKFDKGIIVSNISKYCNM